MAEVILSNRMQALTDMVTPGTVITDVGCDHGFVSVYLVQKGISPRVIAMDVRSGPLEHAREHIREYGLEDRIETRLSDGLHSLKTGEAAGMICAGMGGPLMEKILTEGREQAKEFRELILQPQSEIPHFRTFLMEEATTFGLSLDITYATLSAVTSASSFAIFFASLAFASKTVNLKIRVSV